MFKTVFLKKKKEISSFVVIDKQWKIKSKLRRFIAIPALFKHTRNEKKKTWWIPFCVFNFYDLKVEKHLFVIVCLKVKNIAFYEQIFQQNAFLSTRVDSRATIYNFKKGTTKDLNKKHFLYCNKRKAIFIVWHE